MMPVADQGNCFTGDVFQSGLRDLTCHKVIMDNKTVQLRHLSNNSLTLRDQTN